MFSSYGELLKVFEFEFVIYWKFILRGYGSGMYMVGGFFFVGLLLGILLGVFFCFMVMCIYIGFYSRVV